MVYTVTTWAEYPHMTEGEKITGLNNLETIYTEAVNYIDAITHLDRYYTDVEAAVKYFPRGSKTTGSVCETLDGMTAQEIIDAGVPASCIGDWSGSIETIPAGWYLCDGSNSTPDLRGRIVIAAGGSYSYGAIGGQAVQTVNAVVTVAGHALTAAEMPLHTHSGITDYYGGPTHTGYAGGFHGANPTSTTTRSTYTEYAGSGTEHGHEGSTWSPTVDQELMPPYIALPKIMKG